MLVLRTGLFWTLEGDLQVQTSGGAESMDTVLRPYEGRPVHVMLRHLPEDPVLPDSWGGGCCRWYPAECPFGHADHPRKLYAISPKGVLSRDGTHWRVGSTVLRFDWMDGHQGQFILFSPQASDPTQIKDMFQSLSDLKSVVEGLKTEIPDE